MWITLWAFKILTAATLINGAGATFPYPLYSKWFHEYHQKDPNVQINYQSVGSGGGIRQFTDGTVDFGATDAPLTDEQISKLKSPVLHIPTVLGAVAITYNLPEKDLRFTPEILSEIFLGNIKKWEDPKVLALNPNRPLKGDIIVAYRSDGSGTTAVLTDYLCKISPQWKEKVGKGTSVAFPVGIGGKGNEGVSGLIKNTPGSIGYVELVYAESNNLATALLKNSSGEFVKPNVSSIREAAKTSASEIPSDYRVSITNSSGKKAYPISSFTYLIVPKTMVLSPKSEALKKFLGWAMKEGQNFAEPLLYAPLPKNLVKRVEKTIESMEIKKVN